MRCYICDKEDDAISYDRRYQEYSPCGACQEVIYECLMGYDNDGDDDVENH